MPLLEILDELGLLAEEKTVDDLDFDFIKDGCRTRLNALQNGVGEYMITIEKDGYNWFVYAEEHESEDMEASGIKATYKTLRDAKRAAIEFAVFFQSCIWEMEIAEDEDW